MKLMLSLVGLMALGVAAFVGLAALITYREGRPLHPPAEVQAPQDATARRPLEALTVGARMSTATARLSLERGARSEAVYALDAAVRAAEVGKHVAHGKLQDTFEQALHKMRQARHALQNGTPTSAQHHLAAAVATLDAAATAAPTEEATLPEQQTWSAYQDARLINALGMRIGKIDRLRRSEKGPLEAVLVLGGSQNMFGFLDLGGKEINVPAHTLLYGQPQTIGAVLVVVPTFASSAQQIETTVPVVSRNLTP